MQKATFKIRRKLILAFLFSLLSVLIFSAFSFQVHREIGQPAPAPDIQYMREVIL